jgi:hypothetical protein
VLKWNFISFQVHKLTKSYHNLVFCMDLSQVLLVPPQMSIVMMCYQISGPGTVFQELSVFRAMWCLDTMFCRFLFPSLLDLMPISGYHVPLTSSI